MAQDTGSSLLDQGSRVVDDKNTATRGWRAYFEADLGFRNHWYPAFFGKHLAEGKCLGQEMLGERILFKRIDGRVYAIEDRCAHRGVPLSARPECYTKNTISCWYHGFTYDVRNGALVAIITDPDSPLIGKVALKSYPVEEHKNMVFIFIGDEAPHALALDLQPRLPRPQRSRDLSRWRA